MKLFAVIFTLRNTQLMNNKQKCGIAYDFVYVVVYIVSNDRKVNFPFRKKSLFC